MSTPTSYDLTYNNPCDEELGCGEGTCSGPRVEPRTYEFCQDVTIDGNLTVQGASSLGTTSIRPAAITVGGLTFKPIIINTISGPHQVLAVY